MDKYQKLISSLNDEELWKLYSIVKNVLRQRKLTRSGNIVGDKGEDIAIKFYNSSRGEPKLQIAPEGTQNVDALSRKGERYSIKTITYPNRVTGVFYGLNPPNSSKPNDKKFEYIIIVVVNGELQPLEILELSWDQFLNHKKWHSRMGAWNLSLNKELRKDCRIIYKKNTER